MQVQLEDFQQQPRDGYSFDWWKSKEPVSTILGDLFVELNVLDRGGTPDETMVQLANELASRAQTHGESLLDSIYSHYRETMKKVHSSVPTGLTRDEVLAEVESVDLCISRDSDAEPRYDAYIQVVPYWELEHNLFLRYADGQFVEFDPM